MATFKVTFDFRGTATAEIEADSLAQAINEIENSDEIPVDALIDHIELKVAADDDAR